MAFDYEEDIKINLDSLELDCQRQVELVDKYGKEKSRIAKMLADVQEDIKVTRSEIIKETLEKANKKNEKQPTTVQLEAAYRTDQRHKAAKQKFIDLQHKFNILEAGMNTLSNMSYRLTDTIKLLELNYWVGKSVTNGIRQTVTKEDREEADDQTRTAVNEKRRRSRK